MANYVNDRDLTRELILSVGKGKLTDKASIMIILIIKNIQRKKQYISKELQEDVYMEAVLQVLSKSWKTYDSQKSDSCFAFISECAKRALAGGYNKMMNIKSGDDNIRMIRMDVLFEGKGANW